MIQQATEFLHQRVIIPYVILGLFAVSSLPWLFDRDPPFIYQNDVVVERVTPNTVSLSYAAKRVRACPLTVERFLIVNGNRFYFSPFTLSANNVRRLETENPNRVKILLEIPGGAAQGKYFYNVRLDYRCNPIHALWPISVAFEVPFTLE